MRQTRRTRASALRRMASTKGRLLKYVLQSASKGLSEALQNGGAIVHDDGTENCDFKEKCQVSVDSKGVSIFVHKLGRGSTFPEPPASTRTQQLSCCEEHCTTPRFLCCSPSLERNWWKKRHGAGLPSSTVLFPLETPPTSIAAMLDPVLHKPSGPNHQLDSDRVSKAFFECGVRAGKVTSMLFFMQRRTSRSALHLMVADSQCGSGSCHLDSFRR